MSQSDTTPLPIESNETPASQAPPTAEATLSPVEDLKCKALQSQVIEVLKTCYDPEIPVDIYELGLIYEVNVRPEGNVDIKMTLTSPMCPVAGSLPPEVEQKVKSAEGVNECRVEVVWDPPWTPEKMSEAARLQLNL